MRLLPQDYEFIEYIQEEVSDASNLALEIKPDRIKTIIGEAAKWFYEWHPQAVQRKHFLVKRSDIDAARTDKLNSVMKLPDAVKFVFRIRKANSATVLSEATYLRSPIMGMNRFSTNMGMGMGLAGVNGGLGNGRVGGMDMVTTTLAMYEFQTFQSLSNNNRGVAHNWSEFTNEIAFMSDVDYDLVIECGVRVPITSLYSDRLFRQYVVGKSLESLSRIIGTYDFRLVGNVTVNWGDLKSDGKEMVEKVEEEVKGYNSGSFIITR